MSPLLKPQQIYARLGQILGLSGTQGLTGLQDEGVLTQDLTRIMQASRVKQTYYLFTDTPAADAVLTKQWAEASDWTEISINGIIFTADADLPQPEDDRIIISIALQISGTQSHYTTGQVSRFAGAVHPLAEWGAITTGHRGPIQVGPQLLPQWLNPLETSMNLVQEVSGNDSDWNLGIQMLSAEPGILSLFSGV